MCLVVCCCYLGGEGFNMLGDRDLGGWGGGFNTPGEGIWGGGIVHISCVYLIWGVGDFLLYF